jgi:hypothetical protein
MFNPALHFPGRVMLLVVEVDSVVVGDNQLNDYMNKTKKIKNKKIIQCA